MFVLILFRHRLIIFDKIVCVFPCSEDKKWNIYQLVKRQKNGELLQEESGHFVWRGEFLVRIKWVHIGLFQKKLKNQRMKE